MPQLAAERVGSDATASGSGRATANGVQGLSGMTYAGTALDPVARAAQRGSLVSYVASCIASRRVAGRELCEGGARARAQNDGRCGSFIAWLQRGAGSRLLAFLAGPPNYGRGAVFRRHVEPEAQAAGPTAGAVMMDPMMADLNPYTFSMPAVAQSQSQVVQEEFLVPGPDGNPVKVGCGSTSTVCYLNASCSAQLPRASHVLPQQGPEHVCN